MSALTCPHCNGPIAVVRAEVSVQALQSALNRLTAKDIPADLTEDIVARAAKAIGVAPMDVLDSSKHARAVSFARHIVAYVLHAFYGRSYSEIGRALKQKDHTSATHGYRRIHALVIADGEEGKQMAALVNAIARRSDVAATVEEVPHAAE